MERILVIKLGALGDFILSLRAMTAIRAHHGDGKVTLLTIPSLEGLARATGLFDDVWVDSRPGILQVGAWLGLAKRLNAARFDRVYDLQTADRTGFYFRLMGWPFSSSRPEWSGIVAGCSHRHDSPDRTTKHTLERQADQLAIAGIDAGEYPPLNFSWARADISRHGLDRGYVLMVPGGSAVHPEKRWPAAHFAALARRLVDDGLRPVLIGTEIEADTCAEIAAVSDRVLNLCGDSPMLEVMALARDAVAAVGNDTGPMHLIAPLGCPCLVLYSAATRPETTRPRGPYEGPGHLDPPPGGDGQTVAVMRADNLADITPEAVRAAMIMR